MFLHLVHLQLCGRQNLPIEPVGIQLAWTSYSFSRPTCLEELGRAWKSESIQPEGAGNGLDCHQS